MKSFDTFAHETGFSKVGMCLNMYNT